MLFFCYGVIDISASQDYNNNDYVGKHLYLVAKVKLFVKNIVIMLVLYFYTIFIL